MAALPVESPVLNHHPSISPFSPKLFGFSHPTSYRKPPTTSLFPLQLSSHSHRGRRLRPMASLGGLLGGIFKGTDTGESTRQQYAGTVTLINNLEAEMSAVSDSELRDRTRLLKERAQRGESLDSLLPVSFQLPNLFLIPRLATWWNLLDFRVSHF